MINRFRKKIEEYISVSDYDWNRIKEDCELIDVKNREVLIRYSEFSRDGFFLVSGSFEMSLITEKGEANTVWFFLDELFNVFATFDSLCINKATQYEITALEDSVVVKFNREAAEMWKKEIPNISEFMNQVMLDDYVSAQDIRNYMVSSSPVDFITYLRKKFPAIVNRIPDKKIAQFMGISPEWYSKNQKKISNLN